MIEEPLFKAATFIAGLMEIEFLIFLELQHCTLQILSLAGLGPFEAEYLPLHICVAKLNGEHFYLGR